MTKTYLRLQEILIWWYCMRTCIISETIKRISIKFGINILTPQVTGQLLWFIWVK
jgi:hypothetical protein